MATPFIYDSDLIGDDLLALITAMGIPEIDLLGITAFGRRVKATERALIAAEVLDCMGITDIPVAAGADRPLLRVARPGCTGCDHPIFEFRDSFTASEQMNIRQRIFQKGAVALMVNAIQKSPGALTVLCTGPLTNLALAVSIVPEIASQVKKVVIMGGAAWVPGNVTSVAESNIYNDPEAAAIVFERFPKITMIGLDVTLQTLIDESTVKDLFKINSKLGSLVSKIIISCIQTKIPKGLTKMPLHDPLALMAMAFPDLVNTVSCEVKIETVGELSVGQTICTPLSLKKQEPVLNVVNVAKEVNVEKAISLFNAALLKATPRIRRK
jgi:inosine-uridine nucleoside N-ribohydrolase